MDTNKELSYKPNPWKPTSNEKELKVLGKSAEEVNELGSALARCIIQGVNEMEPITKKPNIQWMTEEIADVLACIELLKEQYNLDEEAIEKRVIRKKNSLKEWLDM